ncbi:MAG: hypothetical protein M3Q26_08250 [Acidobacteriota bacterium]|nr:hypothetical protein [Acidobacteriota bacterium]
MHILNRPFLIVFTLVLLSVTNSAQGRATGASDDRYRIYDAVIERMFAGNKINFDGPSKVDHLIIRERTITEYAYNEKKEDWQQVKNRLKNLSAETIVDYEANLGKATKLKRSFNIQLNYSLLPQKQYSDIFAGSQNYNATEEGWKKFHDTFPGSAGYIMLSNIGFDRSRKQALVYFVHWCGYVCGSGHYILLDKVEKQWRVAAIGGIWIS